MNYKKLHKGTLSIRRRIERLERILEKEPKPEKQGVSSTPVAPKQERKTND